MFRCDDNYFHIGNGLAFKVLSLSVLEIKILDDHLLSHRGCQLPFLSISKDLLDVRNGGPIR